MPFNLAAGGHFMGLDKKAILNLVSAGKKIEAIKTIQSGSDWDLAMAKAYVDSVVLEALGPLPIPDGHTCAAAHIHRLIPSIKKCRHTFDVQTILDCAHKELNHCEYFRFPDWNDLLELEAYDADSEIVHIVFDGVETAGNVIVVSDELETPEEFEFRTLADDIDKLPVSLLPFDMIFIWKSRPVISVVGHWGIYAHLNPNVA